MNAKKTSMLMIASVVAVMLVSVATSEQAFAHGGKTFEFTLPNGETRSLTVIMGHNKEPTYAQEKGKHDGKHPMELFISDTATGLNLAEASLTVDKFYYKNEKQFEKDAKDGKLTSKVEDAEVNGVHGDPGHYFARHILAKPGLYGYHVSGTVDYFGVLDVPIDLMAMCRDAPSDFNTPGWFSGYGCTVDVDDTKFPKGGHHSNNFGDKDDNEDDD